MGETKEKLSFMYAGPQAIVDRDDYLKGRKLDKNFELFAGDIKPEKTSRLDEICQKPLSSAPVASELKGGLLDLDTIKKEDPLVAIKVREEKARREILENPIKMKQLEKIIVSTMEKKMLKMMKREAKKKSDKKADRRAASSSSSSSSSERAPKHRASERRSQQTRPRRHCDFKEPFATNKSDSRGNRSRTDRRTVSGDAPKTERLRRPASHNSESSSSEATAHESRHSKPESLDHHHHSHRIATVSSKRKLSNSEEDSSSEQRSKTQKSYGLIVLKDTIKSDRKDYREDYKHLIPAKTSTSAACKPESRSKLTDEERQKRLSDMQANAQWRDDQRRKNVHRLEKEEKAEEEELLQSSNKRNEADFVRKQLERAAQHGTVADRIKSNVHNIQRGHGTMDKHFAKR